jgi:UDP-GlcNAc:undecaprenyl-phosphate GlcNAc-1-phosphate transferase
LGDIVSPTDRSVNRMFAMPLAQTTRPLITPDSVMSPNIYIFYVAFIISYTFTPIMRFVALRYRIVDKPDNLRKMHTVPVAYLGGIAVFLGWIAGFSFSNLIPEPVPQTFEPFLTSAKLAITAGACIVLALGLWDDMKRLKPSIKIAGQLLAAVIILSAGVGTHCMGPILNPAVDKLGTNTFSASEHFPDWFVVAASWVTVIFIVVACCNATNLMDGLDGLCGGVTAIMAGGLLFLAINMAVVNVAGDLHWDALRIAMALALMGAVLGFVPFNFNPASIFMGDAGSMFLGYAGAVMIVSLAEVKLQWFLGGTVIFALPFLDTALALVRRWVNRRPFFSADRKHFHHQLVDRGLTVRQTVLVSYGLTLIFALLGVSVVFMRVRYAVAVYLVFFGSLVVAAYKMGMVHERPRVVGRRPLGPGSMMPSPTMSQPGNVLEIRDADLPQSGAAVLAPQEVIASTAVQSQPAVKPDPTVTQSGKT